MAIQQKQIDYAKEIDDVMSFVIHLIKDIKNKESVEHLVTHLLPDLMAAIGGIDQVPIELQSRHVVENTVLLKLTDLVEVFMGA